MLVGLAPMTMCSSDEMVNNGRDPHHDCHVLWFLSPHSVFTAADYMGNDSVQNSGKACQMLSQTTCFLDMFLRHVNAVYIGLK